MRGQDYSFAKDGLLSAWTVVGRNEAAWCGNGFGQCMDSSACRFGTAKIVCRDGERHLHVPVIFAVPGCDTAPSNTAGVDSGVKFAVATDDNAGKTVFESERVLRRELKKRHTVRKKMAQERAAGEPLEAGRESLHRKETRSFGSLRDSIRSRRSDREGLPQRPVRHGFLVLL